MAKFEATQAQWKRLFGELPGPLTAELPAGDDLPVGNVNFAETEEFCRKLTERGRESGDLPRDWDSGCRPRHSGNTRAARERRRPPRLATRSAAPRPTSKDSPTTAPRRVRLSGGPPGLAVTPPNAWGLHDMHGNTFEWCRDWYHSRLPGGTDPDLYSARDSATRNRDGTVSRARRGGAWTDDGWSCRSAFRLRFEPERRYDHIGFRVVAVEITG